MTSIDALRGTGDPTWTAELLAEADTAGNRDGQITVAELDGYLKAATDGSGAIPASGPGALQLPATTGVNVRQNASASAIATLRSRIAERTGEQDMLRPRGPGLQLLHTYSRSLYDDQRRVPLIVSYVLAASDIREEGPERKDAFTSDKSLPSAARATSSDYAGSGYDRGHMRPADDSANADAMRESFLMSNMAPQTATLNRHVWKELELAIRQAVRASGGEAVVFTGNLFLGADGTPMPASEVRWVTRNGKPRVAIPTHCFKAALIRMPDGHMTMVGFVVPNQDGLPTQREDIRPLLQSSTRSIADIERLSGITLFDDLPDDIERPMEAAAGGCLVLPQGSEMHAVSLIFPEGCTPQSWTVKPGEPTGATPTRYGVTTSLTQFRTGHR